MIEQRMLPRGRFAKAVAGIRVINAPVSGYKGHLGPRLN
jgi:hypothetical protein